MTPEQIRADRKLSKAGPRFQFVPGTGFMGSKATAFTLSGEAWNRRVLRLPELEDVYLALTDRVAQLEKALTLMVNEKVGYMMLNKLGNPEDQHTIKQARIALTGEKP